VVDKNLVGRTTLLRALPYGMELAVTAAEVEAAS
jgi:hypothetical protein